MVKLVILGPNGAMGRALVKRAVANEDIAVVAGVGPSGRAYIGSDLGLLVGLGRRIGAGVVDSLDSVVEECDIVLECTRPEVSTAALRTCVAYGKGFVTGTTGFSPDEMRLLRQAGDVIPVLRASNGSPVVHLLYDLLQIVTRELGREADIDIVEIHGRNKPDAPSRTAQEMGQLIAAELGQTLSQVAEYGRRGMRVRASDSIQFSSIRSGGTRSTHRVIFGLPYESLELSHQVFDTEAFAGGLVQAVLYASDQSRGYFTLDDVL